MHGTLEGIHRVVPRRCLFRSWSGACFLLSRPLSNFEAVQLHQIPLSNQSTKAVFRWEFYLGLCKMCRHKELQKTSSFIAGLSKFFPCPHFPGSLLKQACVFISWRNHRPHHVKVKTYSLLFHKKKRATPVKSSPDLWVQVAVFLHVGM